MDYNVSGNYPAGTDCKIVTLNKGDVCEILSFEKPKIHETGRVIGLTDRQIILDMSAKFNSNIKKFDINKIKDINIIHKRSI